MIEIIALGLGLVGFILLANILVLRGNLTEQRLFHGLLFLLNVPVMLLGLALMAIPADSLDRIMVTAGVNPINGQVLGLNLVLMALWGLAVTLTPMRKALARVMPLDPASPVHTLALVFAGYLVGQSTLILSQGGLTSLADTVQPASIGVFVLTEILFVVVAFFGVGFVVRRHGHQLKARLGLVRPRPDQLVVGTAIIAILVILQAVAGATWSLLNPEQAEALDSVNSLLLSDVNTVWEWLILALAAGIGEELLFRGALQPVMGLGFTAVLFAVIHVQYGFTPVTLFIVLLALVLGLIRRYYNTTMAIYVHVGYDFVLGLLALLVAYLDRFIN